MTYIRTRKVTKDGATFVIAAYTAGQVEQMFSDTGDDGVSAFQKAQEQICLSLNASGGNPLPNGAVWTPEALKEQTDTQTQIWLQSEIYELTGLKVAAADAGESDAAAPAIS